MFKKFFNCSLPCSCQFLFFLLIFLLMVVLLVSSCTGAEKSYGLKNETIGAISEKDGSVQGNETAEGIVKGEETKENEQASLCVAGWKCISSSARAYQSGNCSWSKKEECSLRCKEGNCTCSPGFACKNGSIRGYQTEECAWLHEQYCSFGCVESACLSFPQKKQTNEPAGEGTESISTAPTNVTPAVLATEVVEGVNYLLAMGEKKKISFKGKEHEIWLYNIEEGRVKINLDQWESDWLSDKGNYTFGGEVQLFIDEILFQPYQGGKKSVSYNLR
ncbi:MAG: hypothetical protein AB1668_00270 [Nanoarchaeota archaeon]